MRRRLLNLGAAIAVVAATLAVAPSLPSSAEVPPEERPGQLQKSFNPCRPEQTAPCDGRVTTAIPGGELSQSHAVAAQTDGKAVVAGSVLRAGSFAVARYKADGDLDPEFGDGGLVTTLFPRRNSAQPTGPTAGPVDEGTDLSDYAAAFAVAVYPETDAHNPGKILAAGCACQHNAAFVIDYESEVDLPAGLFALVRYNRDGTLDTSFGDGGIVRTAFPKLNLLGPGQGPLAVVRGLGIYTSGVNAGKVVAVGTARDDLGRHFAVARYNRDGGLDAGFGTSGMVTTAFPTSDDPRRAAGSFAIARDVAIQTDDRIVVAGFNVGKFAVARYMPNGTLEAKTTNTQQGLASSVVLQGDGNILLAGTTSEYDPVAEKLRVLAAVIRLRGDTLGLDTTFNSCAPGQNEACGGVAMLDFFKDGSHDDDPEAPVSFGRGVAVQQQGGKEKIVLGASSRVFESWITPQIPEYRYGLALARLELDGKVDDGSPQDSDPSDHFGVDGMVRAAFGTGRTFVSDVAFHPQGQITATGWEGRRNYKMAVGLYQAGGEPDWFKLARFPGGNAAFLTALASQADGKVVAVGTANQFVVARYGTDGRLDPAFNPCPSGHRSDRDLCGGLVAPAFPSTCPIDPAVRCVQGSLGHSVAIGDGEHIIAAGAIGRDSDQDPGFTAAFVRYDSGGRLDPQFDGGNGDGNGVVLVPLDCRSYVRDMVVDPAGTITALVSQWGCEGNGEKLTLLRLRRDGTLDPAFNPCPPGHSVQCGGIAPGPVGNSRSSGLVVQSDGNIVIGVYGTNDFILEGFKKDGTPNEDFGDTSGSPGKVTTPFSRPVTLLDLAVHGAGSKKNHIVAVGGIGGVQGDPASGHATSFAVAQYTPSGKVDPDFNPCVSGAGQALADCGGKTTTPFGPPEYATKASAIAESVSVGADGKIVAAGHVFQTCCSEPPSMFALARYTPNGALDTQCYGFGQGGKLSTSFTQPSRVTNVVVQEDGSILAGGFALAPRSNDQYRFALARYHGGSPECGFSVADPPIVSEPVSGATPVTFTVTREGDPTLPATVDYTTLYDGSAGSAVPGSDYTEASGRLSFGIGESTKTVTVEVLADPEVEDPEHFLLRLSNPVGAEIVDDTAKAVITNTSPSIAIGDTKVPEPTSGTVPASFTLTMSNPVPYPVRVTYATANGTATAGSDYNAATRAVTIPAGDTDALVTIDVIGDTDAEGEEDFFVDVGKTEGAVVGKSRGRGVIFEPGPGISIGDTSVTEGNSGITRAAFTVVANRESTKAVTVDYATANGSATAGEDYRRATGTVSLAPGEMGKTVVVEVIADTAPEADETYSLNLGTPVGAELTRASGTGTIVNDDTAEPDVVLPPPPPGGPPPTPLTGLPGTPAPPSLVAPQVPGQVQAPGQAQATSQAPSQAASQATAPSVANSPAAAAQAQAQFAPHVAAQAQAQPQAAMMVERERQAQVETVGVRGGGLAAASLMASARQPSQPGPAPVLALVWAGAVMGIGLGVADRRRHRSGAFAGVHPVQDRSARRRHGGWRRRAGGPGARSR